MVDVTLEASSFFDAEGNRTGVEHAVLNENGTINTNQKIEERHFDYSADGNLVKKQTGTQNGSHAGVPSPYTVGFETHEGTASHYMYANKQYLGEFNENGRIQVKSQHFDSLDPGNVGSSQRYTVQPGQTLRQIATLFYGNADYWYIVADINGLQVDGDAPLTEGQILEIPDRQTNENRFDNFKPDSIIDKIGSTTPTLPYIPPPQEAGCNALASIIIIVVAIVVTVYTAGAAAGVTGATTTTTAGTAAATGSAATAGAAGSAVSFGAAGAASTTFAAGSAALGGSLGLQGAIAAGIGGFAGSLAGQAVGNILGVQDGFSLKGALVSGLTAGLTAGAGSVLRGAEWAVDGANLSHAGKAALAATSALTNAATNKLVGNPSGFSWASVAASAGTAAIASSLNLDGGSLFEGGTLDGDFGSDLIGGFARAGIGYGISKGVFNKGSWNFENVASDVFGNAIGNSIVRQASQPSWEEQAQKLNDGINTAFSNGAGSPSISGENVNGGSSTNNGSYGGDRGFSGRFVTDESGGQIEVFTVTPQSDPDFGINQAAVTSLVQDAGFFASSIAGISDLRFDNEVRDILGSNDRLFDAGINQAFEIAHDRNILANSLNGLSVATGGAIGVRGFKAVESATIDPVLRSNANEIFANSKIRNSFSTQIQNARNVSRSTSNPFANFRTIGVNEGDARAFLSTSDGKDLIGSLVQGGHKNPIDKALEIVTSGSGLPSIQRIESGQSLIKITSSDSVGATSPFFTTPLELAQAKASGQTISDFFGLPLASETTAFKVFEITPRSTAGANVFVSKVAPATDNLVIRSGGGTQFIVPNRNDFTQPVLIQRALGN